MCILYYAKMKEDKYILAKNRDKVYNPKINIYHEIIHGVEMVYIYDKKTQWIEGMTSAGVGIVNATFIQDANRIKVTKKNIPILNAMMYKKKDELLNCLLHHCGNTIEGNTLIYVQGDVYRLENNTKENKNAMEKITEKSPYVLSNHGYFSNPRTFGYTKCIQTLSSFLRRKSVEKELKQRTLVTYDDVANVLNQNYVNVDPRLHSYRDARLTRKVIKPGGTIVKTTGQLILNMTDMEFVYYRDIHNSGRVRYINKLPRDYVPQIRVILKNTEKSKTPVKIFTRKYINKIEKKFNCTRKNNYSNL